MVLLDLQPSPLSGQCNFQQIDAKAALQQLESQRLSPVKQARATTGKSHEASNILLQPKHSLVVPQQTSFRQTPRHHLAKARLQHLCSDGMRLSDVGDGPLAIDTAQHTTHEIAPEQPACDPVDQASTSERSAANADDDLEVSALLSTKHTGYICSTKNDPLVKGRAGLPKLFSIQDSIAALRPMADVDTSTSPRSPEHAEQPVLLQNLEAFLADKLQMADRLQAAYKQQGKTTLAGANLILDAHRQVFEAFIHSFTTYRPLLLGIKGAYEEALQDALASQAENIHMKAQLAVLQQRKAEAVEKARSSGNDAAVTGRGQLYEALLEAQSRQENANQQAAAAEAANAASTAELRAARAEAAELRRKIQQARQSMFASSSFVQG